MDPIAKWLLIFFAVISIVGTLISAVDPEPLIDKVWLSPWCSLSNDNTTTHSPMDFVPPPNGSGSEFTGAPEFQPTNRELCKNRVRSVTGSMCSMAICLAALYVVYRVFYKNKKK